MSFFKLLFSFLPWILFLVIARESLLRVKIGLVVALVSSLVMGITKLHQGVILWAGLLFFTYSTLAVIVFDNMWTVKHLGIMANGLLALSTWLTILFKQPFTLIYARQHTDSSTWHSPLFIRINFIISSVWSSIFTLNTILAWGKMERLFFPELGYEIITYILLIGTAFFTNWYPNYLRRKNKKSGDDALKD